MEKISKNPELFLSLNLKDYQILKYELVKNGGEFGLTIGYIVLEEEHPEFNVYFTETYPAELTCEDWNYRCLISNFKFVFTKTEGKELRYYWIATEFIKINQ